MTDIKKGTVVRGLKNADLKPFGKEDLDGDDRLTDASVNCIEGETDTNLIMAGMPASMHAYGFRTASAEKIIQKGGRVMKAEIKGNPNHCQIFGLSLKDATNLFS